MACFLWWQFPPTLDNERGLSSSDFSSAAIIGYLKHVLLLQRPNLPYSEIRLWLHFINQIISALWNFISVLFSDVDCRHFSIVLLLDWNRRR